MSDQSKGFIFSDTHIYEIIAMRRTGAQWTQIANTFYKKYGIDRGRDAYRRAYNNYKHLYDIKDKKRAVEVMRETVNARRLASKHASHNRAILEFINDMDDVVEQIKNVVAELKDFKLPKIPITQDKNRPPMTMEALVSDVHIGKKSKEFNLEICEARLNEYAKVLIDEIKRNSKNFNVERLILAFLGDNIENALMHGRESAMGCEFGNPDQVVHAIRLFMTTLVLPLAALGLPLDIICIPGNHDREEERKTHQLTGYNSLAWIIYSTMRMMCEQMKLKNVKFIIPKGAYVCLDIYGTTVDYEHGDMIKGTGKGSYLLHMAKRSAQVKKTVDCLRIGHWHEYAEHDAGAVIVNASVCGGDSYSDNLGYSSVPGQAINYYVKTKNRRSSFYHSFLVQL